MSVRAEAPAKVNLALRVLGREASGLHLIRSLAQAIDWNDSLEAEPAPEDHLEVVGAELPTGTGNLVWKALNLYREAAEKVVRLRLRLYKEIPTAAGLGGGSTDAAAALVLAGEIIGGDVDLAEVAARVGADVPFCLGGGTALLEGFGERIDPVAPSHGYVLALVVPPFELSTRAVYEEWDRLGRPADPGVSGRGVPPSLRDYTPLVNDLYPAAASLQPGIQEWRAALRDAWERPVSMTGSGPTLFSYFADVDEGESALRAVQPGARATAVARPIPRGASINDR